MANHESPPPGSYDIHDEGFGELTELLDGKRFPRTVKVGVAAGPDPDDHRAKAARPVMVTVWLKVVDGRVEQDGVYLSRAPDGSAVTNALVKSLNVDRLAELAAEVVALKVAMRTAGPGWAAWVGELAPSTSGYRPVTAGLLHQVADIYQADDTGRPTQAVADKLSTGHRNAARWVALARKEKLIPPYRKD